jgi:phosphomethylpyrimidine synthase
MTLIMHDARAGKITDPMRKVAEKEKVTPEFIRAGIAAGRIIIPQNVNHSIPPLGIGQGLFIKINSNIGTSMYVCDKAQELEKARISVQYGADTLMDLSTGKTEEDVRDLRKQILSGFPVPLGTVPIYQAGLRALRRGGAIIDMSEDDMFNVVEEQAKEGVDFFTIHAGITLALSEHIKSHRRMMGVVSRGGTFLTAWCLHHQQENPFHKNFDYLLEMAQKYDFALSLGDGMRPGCVFDSTDYAQVQELIELGDLVDWCWAKDIQVMVEGPGHMPANQIAANMQMQKQLCKNAPFYVLGPLVTDIAPGYDHITAAIGGTIAAMSGASYLCYVTPAEHLGLPTIEETKRGVIASKIAAHAADIVLRPAEALEWDRKMDIARKNLDWDGMINTAIDPETAAQIHYRGKSDKKETRCSMCGDFCAIQLLKDALGESDDQKKDEC